MNQRQLESMLTSEMASIKHELPIEYGNILCRQGRSKDTGNFTSTEMDMEAMCDAYMHFFSRAIAFTIDANNRKLLEDLRKYLNDNPEKS